MLGYGHEQIVDVGPRQRRCLQMVVKVQLLHQIDAIFRLHFALVGITQVCTVSNQVT